MDAEEARRVAEHNATDMCAMVKKACDRRIEEAAKTGEFSVDCALLPCSNVKTGYHKRGFDTWPIDPQCTAEYDTVIEW